MRQPKDIRSSPPTIGTELDQNDLLTQGGQIEMDATPSDSETTTPTDTIEISSNIDVYPIIA
jgi:hypothetical protein